MTAAAPAALHRQPIPAATAAAVAVAAAAVVAVAAALVAAVAAAAVDEREEALEAQQRLSLG